MAFEKIVRPFQNRDVFTARVNAPVPPAILKSPDVATMKWGGSEEARWSEDPGGVFNGVGVELIEDKSRRITEQVRITNPNDETQYVDVERMKSTVMTDSQTGKEFRFRFANWDAGRKGP